MKRFITVIAITLAVLFGNTSTAHAAISTTYTNWPRSLPYVVDEWFTMNNQPPVWSVMAMPFGYYTGLCAFRGARWDGQYLPFWRSTGAVEGFVEYYAMDANHNCRHDIPINMAVNDVRIYATYADGANLNARQNICYPEWYTTSGNRTFVRQDNSGCSPPMDASHTWYLGWYQMRQWVSWRFNNDWHAEASFYTWPAALVNNNGCFSGLDNWGRCLRPDGTWS